MSFEKSFGDAVAKSFEPGASSVKERLKSLEQIRLSGTKTFAFIGPLLPGNLVDVLEGKVDRVFIDRMNYLHSVKGFYRDLGLERETTDRFFDEHRKRLVAELRKRKMNFEVLFKIGG
ncbi:MAG: hypothetical protein L6406_08030 [Desulfobacterales bacterium]|nr:hypothetical protein [Desulfobacterales bacterium]